MALSYSPLAANSQADYEIIAKEEFAAMDGVFPAHHAARVLQAQLALILRQPPPHNPSLKLFI
jgi:hypothetical protein